MIRSRNLCDFEKNVLLTLIGGTLQPNKIAYGGGGDPVMVRDLLQMFCSSLEEQIEHRKYFYKSSSLVREGMVVVHSSGLTGDTSSASVGSFFYFPLEMLPKYLIWSKVANIDIMQSFWHVLKVAYM